MSTRIYEVTVCPEDDNLIDSAETLTRCFDDLSDAESYAKALYLSTVFEASEIYIQSTYSVCYSDIMHIKKLCKKGK